MYNMDKWIEETVRRMKTKKKYFPIILGGSLVGKDSFQLFVYFLDYPTVQRKIMK